MASQKDAIGPLLDTLCGEQREALLDLAQGPNLSAVGQLLEALREERGR
ncbi:hypothetical protein [Streptomyces sp. NPDC057616]